MWSDQASLPGLCLLRYSPHFLMLSKVTVFITKNVERRGQTGSK